MINEFYRVKSYLIDKKLNHEKLEKLFDREIDEEPWRKIILKTMYECYNELIESGRKVEGNFANSCDDFVVDLHFCTMYKSYKNCPKNLMKDSRSECKIAMNFLGNCWNDQNAISDYLKLVTHK